MDTNDITRKRSTLLSARIRFSPQTQPVIETAIDLIVGQNLLLVDSAEALTLQEISEQGAFCFVGGSPVISRLDIHNSLERLTDAGRVVVSREAGQERYRLSEQASQELWEVQRSAERRFSQVVETLVSGKPSVAGGR